MRLATLRTPSGTRAVRVDDDALVELNAPDLGAWLARPDWREHPFFARNRVAAEADRVAKSRTAQSHRSTRVESTGPAYEADGG